MRITSRRWVARRDTMVLRTDCVRFHAKVRFIEDEQYMVHDIVDFTPICEKGLIKDETCKRKCNEYFNAA